MIAIADLAARHGGDIRLTRQQNFILTLRDPGRENRGDARRARRNLGFPLEINPLQGNSIACTGEPHCNFLYGRRDQAPDPAR